MTPELLLFIFGALLILIGILGGGFDVKELKIPKVGAGVRICAILGGLFFIALGIGIQASGSTPGSSNSSGSPSPVNFMIYDDLGEGQVSEQVNVLIDGRFVGDLEVNQRNRRCRLPVFVPQEGLHSYHLESSAIFRFDGANREFTGVGQGTIDVRPGKVFSARGGVSGDTWLVSLEEGSP